MDRTPLTALAIALLLAASSLAPVARAAEAAPPADAGEQPAADVPAADGATAPEDGAASDGGPDGQPGVDAADDVFVPSVEVSEDTSVPFPVDI